MFSFCIIDSDTDLQKCFTDFFMPLSLQPLFFKLSLKFLLVVPNQKLIYLCNGLEMEWIKTEWVEGEHIFRNFNSLPGSWHFVRIAKIFSLTFYLTSVFNKANHNIKLLLHSGLNFVSIMCKCIHLYPNCKWPHVWCEQKQWGEFRYLQQIFSSVLPNFSNIKYKLKIRLKCYGKKINRQFPLMELHWLLNVTIWVTTSTESNKSLKPVESKGSTDHLSLLSDCCSWKVMPGHHLYIQPGSAVSLGQQILYLQSQW